MRLDLDIDPTELPTAQQKGVTRDGRVYTKPEIRRAKGRLLALLADGTRFGRPRWPEEARLAGPWACTIELVYAFKSTRRADRGRPKATRPDLDNLAKLILDALTASGLFWADDGQVAELAIRKRFARASAPDFEGAHILVSCAPIPKGAKA